MVLSASMLMTCFRNVSSSLVSGDTLHERAYRMLTDDAFVVNIVRCFHFLPTFDDLPAGLSYSVQAQRRPELP